MREYNRSLVSAKVLNIASVSYLNARPLIHGLERDPRVKLSLDVPSKLIQKLRDGDADVALLPTIDYQRQCDLVIIPAGGIGSDGATLTVRIFSRCPIDQIRSLACDGDSHTSIALARIILARRHNLRPEFTDLSRAGEDPHQARLLIGDKVVCDEPRGFANQLDLGSEWKALTGLPFVFATWMARSGADTAALYTVLDQARQRGLAQIDCIIADFAEPRGWPPALARQYLTSNLRFGVGQRELEAIRAFHRMAFEERILPNDPAELRVCDISSSPPSRT